MTLSDFDRKLAVFDWTYEFSDDARVYRRGSLGHQELRAQATALGTEAEGLLQAYQRTHYYSTASKEALLKYRTDRGLA